MDQAIIDFEKLELEHSHAYNCVTHQAYTYAYTPTFSPAELSAKENDLQYKARKYALEDAIRLELGEKYAKTRCNLCKSCYFHPYCSSTFHHLPAEWLKVWSDCTIDQQETILKALREKVIHFMEPALHTTHLFADYGFATKYAKAGLHPDDVTGNYNAFLTNRAQKIDIERSCYLERGCPVCEGLDNFDSMDPDDICTDKFSDYCDWAESEDGEYSKTQLMCEKYLGSGSGSESASDTDSY